MRKLIVYNRLSMDGCFAGANGEMDWFLHDPAVDKLAHEVVGADTLLFGRVTYQLFESFWSGVADDPDADPTWREAARELDAMDKWVASRSLSEASWVNSRLLDGDLVDETRRIKADEGGRIGVFGSGSVVRQLASAGLVDEYLIVLSPYICGDGMRLFDSAQNLTLLDTWTFDSGNVLLHYAVPNQV